MEVGAWLECTGYSCRVLSPSRLSVVETRVELRREK